MAQLINIRLKVDIEGGKSNLDFSKLSLVNAGDIKVVLIDAPAGETTTDTEQWIELQNIDKDSTYENVQIVSEDFDTPISLGNINLASSNEEAITLPEVFNVQLKVEVEGGKSNINFADITLVNADGVELVLIDAPAGEQESENVQWIELQNIKRGVEYRDIQLQSNSLDKAINLGNINVNGEVTEPVEQFTSIKLIVEIEEGKDNVNFNELELRNAPGVEMRVIDAPEGTEENNFEQWIELQNIDRYVEYEEIHLYSDSLEEPIMIGDIYIQGMEDEAAEEAKAEAEERNRKPGKVPAMKGAKTDEIELHDINEEHEISSELAFDKLVIAEAETKRLEAEHETAVSELERLTKIVDEKDSTIAEIENEQANINKKYKESQAKREADLNSSREEGISEDVKARLLDSVKQEEMNLEMLKSQASQSQAALAQIKESAEPYRTEKVQAAATERDLHKKVVASRKEEEHLKVIILNTAAKKTTKAQKANLNIEKLEEHAQMWRNEIDQLKDAVQADINKSRDLDSQVQELVEKAKATNDSDEKALLEAEAAKLHSLDLVAQSEIKKFEKKIAKLEEKSAKAEAKAEASRNKTAILNRDAHEANEVAKRIRGLRISELENQINSKDLTKAERKSLTQEITNLKIDQTQIGAREAEDELTHEVKVVTNSKMTFAEKYVKSRFKKTYWVIYERGSRSRNAEIDHIIQEQEDYKKELMLEAERRMMAEQAKLAEQKAQAEAEIAAIKFAAQSEGEKAKAEAEAEKEAIKKEVEAMRAANEEAKAEAQREAEAMRAANEEAKAAAHKEAEAAKEAARKEVEEAKAEGERILAEQKDEIEAKVHQAEKMIADDKARHDEIENGLREEIAKAEEARAKLEADNKHAQDEINKLTESLHKEAEAREEALKAREELLAKLDDTQATHEKTTEELKAEAEKALKEYEAKHKAAVEEYLAKHEAEITELDKAVAEAQVTADEAREAADAQVKELKAEADKAIENAKKEHAANADDLLKKIKELEDKLEKTLKAKAISDKKAALLSQIESLVEEDINN